jgi:hypothetical protein
MRLPTPSTALRAGLAALAMTGLALLFGERSARAQDAGCNPFVTTCTTTVPPDSPFNGFIEFNLASSGCQGFAGGGVQMQRACGDFVPVNMGTTIQQKCMALVSTINASCGTAPGQTQFQADGTNCGTGTFSVTDVTCNSQTPIGTGLSLLIASSATITPGTLQGSGMLPDYEQDIIKNGCQSAGDSLAILGGAPTGSAINGSQSTVLFVVSTPSQGTVVETVQTNSSTSIASIVSQGVAKANLSLTAIQSNIRCAQDSVTPSVAKCSLQSDAGAADSVPAGVPVSFQVNDTGLTRAVMAGPSKDILAAKQMIDSAGGIPNVVKFNFVGGTTCSPCDGGAGGPLCCVTTPMVPAFGGWSFGALMVVLGGAGFILARRGLVKSKLAS